MSKTAKKVILVIVEGISDESALSPALSKIFHSEKVHFHLVRGDMTTKDDITSGNAVVKVKERVKQESDLYKFRQKDILEVIHLIDTDGAFIPDTSVLQGVSPEIQYADDHIESSHPEKTVMRNQRKTQVVKRLYLTSTVYNGLPYRIFYFSRNMEHVLHNDSSNLSDSEKAEYADTFAKQYGTDAELFKSFISAEDFAVPGDYRATWEFIMKEHNSLHRYSNLHLIIPNDPAE